MKKKLLCAALLAGAACAHAAETTWSFTYQGFIDTNTGLFMPDVKLEGTFTGTDRDSDGIIVQEELTGFSTGGYTYLNAQGQGCAQDGWSPYLRCIVHSFSYKLTGELDYSTDRWGNDEYAAGWYGQVRTGNFFLSGSYSDVSEQEQRYDWSNQTRFSITAAPVPEPVTAVMLPAGLALMLITARRRRHKVSL